MFGYDVYALAGDGCMMEGISAEAASLAGHLQLDNLCLDLRQQPHHDRGAHALAFSEDVATRFIALRLERDARRRRQRSRDARPRVRRPSRRPTGRPTLIIVDSHIGYGAPTKQDTHAAHGEPLGEEEIRAAKRFYGWPEDAKFLVPDGVREHFAAGIGARGAKLRAGVAARASRPTRRNIRRKPTRSSACSTASCPTDGSRALPTFPADAKGLAGRDASAKVLNAVAQRIPWLIGGSADLAPSTKTRLTFDGAGDFEAGSYSGRNFHFGIREHAMGAVLNGLSLSKIRPYGSGFLIFSDYGRAPIRLAAIMEIPVIYVFTHDSIGVGEDGPTHQPVEQILSLRAIPGLVTIRPGDANEVAEAWRYTLGAPPRAGGARALSARRCRRSTARSTRPASGLAQRRLRAGRRARRQAGGAAHRHRQRGVAVCRGARAADEGGHQEPRREHAVVGAVRRSAGGVPGLRAAAVGDGARLGRAGVDPGLGAIRRARADTSSA